MHDILKTPPYRYKKVWTYTYINKKWKFRILTNDYANATTRTPETFHMKTSSCRKNVEETKQMASALGMEAGFGMEAFVGLDFQDVQV